VMAARRPSGPVCATGSLSAALAQDLTLQDFYFDRARRHPSLSLVAECTYGEM